MLFTPNFSNPVFETESNITFCNHLTVENSCEECEYITEKLQISFPDTGKAHDPFLPPKIKKLQLIFDGILLFTLIHLYKQDTHTHLLYIHIHSCADILYYVLYATCTDAMYFCVHNSY